MFIEFSLIFNPLRLFKLILRGTVFYQKYRKAVEREKKKMYHLKFAGALSQVLPISFNFRLKQKIEIFTENSQMLFYTFNFKLKS